jgi:hypothetical protein
MKSVGLNKIYFYYIVIVFLEEVFVIKVINLYVKCCKLRR